MHRERQGFTLVELLVVILLLGILVRLAIPAYQSVTLRARAAAALSEIKTVQLAAYSYNIDTGKWPADVYPGIIPPELEPYLDDPGAFRGDGYQLDWENWVLPDGSPMHPQTGVLLGISIVTESDRLGQALVDLVGSGAAKYTLGENYTFVIAAD